MIRLLTLLMMTQSVSAEALIATRTMRAHSVLTASDIAFSSNTKFHGLTDPNDVIGMEARVVLYAGRPIRALDIGPPALVERNQVVPLIFLTSAMMIETEGRALARGAVGDRIRIMNLSSRTTVTGRVTAEGTVQVSK